MFIVAFIGAIGPVNFGKNHQIRKDPTTATGIDVHGGTTLKIVSKRSNRSSRGLVFRRRGMGLLKLKAASDHAIEQVVSHFLHFRICIDNRLFEH